MLKILEEANREALATFLWPPGYSAALARAASPDLILAPPIKLDLDLDPVTDPRKDPPQVLLRPPDSPLKALPEGPRRRHASAGPMRH